jgi:hypothetical protein
MANQFYIQPAVPLAGFQALQKGIGSRVEYERLRGEETRKQRTRQEATDLMRTGDTERLSELAVKNPWITEELDKTIGFRNELTRQNMIDSAKKILTESTLTQGKRLDYDDVKGKVFSTNVFEDDKNRYMENERYIYDTQEKWLYRKDNWGFSGSGGNVAIGPSAADVQMDPTRRDPNIIKPLQEFVTLAGGAPVGPTDVNWKEEYEKGVASFGESPSNILIDRAEFVMGQGGDATGTMELAEQAQDDPESVRKEAETILALYDPASYKQYRETLGEEEPKVGAREILEDGTIIQSTPKGPVVWSPTGERLRGKAAAEAIKIGRAEKVSNIRLAAGEKKRASLEAEEELKGKVEAGVIAQKEAAKISVKAFDRLEKINTNIANLGEGIRLLDEGATTGAVAGLLPSARAASIKLDNLQGRLGLDVLHSTTFGALSAAELRFALSTALPKRLNEVELQEWLEEKRAAQEKLADYIEAAAIYLGTPGNTVSGWMIKQREKRERPAGSAPPAAIEYLRKNPHLKDAFQEKYGYLPEDI